MRPWRPPSPVVRNGPISSKRVSSQDPLLRKFWNLASTASIFAQMLTLKPSNLEIFSSQAPKFGNFQFTCPQILKFSVHKHQIWKFSVQKPPNLEIFSSQAPSFRRKYQFARPTSPQIRAAHPYLKKKKRSWVPLLGYGTTVKHVLIDFNTPLTLFFHIEHRFKYYCKWCMIFSLLMNRPQQAMIFIPLLQFAYHQTTLCQFFNTYLQSLMKWFYTKMASKGNS